MMKPENRPWYVHTLYDAIGSSNTKTLEQGEWVRAVPSPYPPRGIDRIRAAWLVLTGKCVAFQWPKPGDFEIATRND